MDLPDLHTILLPKQPSVHLQNASPTIIVFHTALLLIKKLTLQQWKSLFLPCCPPPWSSWFENSFWKTQLRCQLGGNTLQSCGKVLQKAVLSMLWVSLQYMVLSLWKSEKWSVTTHYCTGKNIASCSYNLMLCWPRGLSSRKKKAWGDTTVILLTGK